MNNIMEKEEFEPNLSNVRLDEKKIKFSALEIEAQELIFAAKAVRKRAYCPYSNFAVGAAFRSAADQSIIYTGCNVENASFTPTSCAERTAITKAVSEGCQSFSSAAVVAYQPDSFTSPCGVCRQFIMEFADNDIPIYIMKDINDTIHDDEEVLCTSAYNLLPHGFRTFKI